MKLEIRALVKAVAVVGAASYALCAGLLALAPEATMRVAGYLMHVDLSAIARPLSWGGALAGILAWTLFTAALAAAAGGLYNRFAGGR
ncbi:MAG: DUF5676 family membrane protein [Acidobacteriota bacterium]